MEKNKNGVWISIVVVLAIIVILVFLFKKDKSAETVVGTEDNTTLVESTQDTVGVEGIGAASISYTNALTKYATRRIQLNSSCQATPNSVTYKDNTGIMIDNRSAESHTVKIGTTYIIKPYSFKIVVLPDIYLKNKTILVDCDAYQNVATILVQE